jgi:hypothetical protein
MLARTIGQPVVALGDQVAGAILAHVVLRHPFPYCVAACLGLCAVRLQVRAEQASARNKPAAEVALLVTVVRQGPIEIAGQGREGVDKRLSVQGGLGDAGGDMRSGKEGSIPEERNPPEDDLRRLQIEDSLKQRLLCPMDYGGYLCRQQVFGTCPEILDNLPPYQRRRDCYTVLTAGGVGAESRKSIVKIDRPVPHEVVPASWGFISSPAPGGWT